MRDLEGKVALVTGSSRGIGASTATELAKRGCSVVIHYCTNQEKAERLAKELEESYQVKTLVLKADLRQEKEIIALVEKTIETFSRIDILVNNAAIAIDTPFEDKTKENFMDILDVNLVGTFLVSKYVGEVMVQNQKGVIINVSSTNGIDTPYIESIDYDASKAGVISLTKNLSTAFAPYVRVNCVCSGWVDTDMTHDLDSEFRKKEESKILLKRFAHPEEIANVIVFLASDDASYVNGSVIRVDGGV